MSSRLFESDLLTQRLHLRKPKVSDYLFQFDFLSKKDHFPYADYKVAESIQDVEDYFNRIMSYQMKSSLTWMICDRNDDLPMGTISAWNMDYEKNSIEFGYSLYPQHRGHGYMQEALQCVIDFCVDELHFTVLDIWTHKDNLASIALAKRLGFQFKGYIDEEAKFSKDKITYAMYQKVVN